MTRDMADTAAQNFEAFQAAGGNVSGIDVITDQASAEKVRPGDFTGSAP